MKLQTILLYNTICMCVYIIILVFLTAKMENGVYTSYVREESIPQSLAFMGSFY